MKNWDEVRTAYYVARLGTVSAAAERLGLHRVTIIRHIEILESDLGEPLFLRGSQGYAPTEAGWELMRVAQAAEEQFDQMASRIRAQVRLRAGELVITSLPEVAPLILPALCAFREAHPDVTLRHIASARNLQLDRGEAHLAIRVAPTEEHPEAVVEPFANFKIALFASDGYLARRGMPQTREDLTAHDFVALEPMEAAPTSERYLDWLRELAPENRIAFRSTSLATLHQAVCVDMGIGLMPQFVASELGLTRVPVDDEHRIGELILLAHADWRGSDRVQALITALKKHAPTDLGL